MAVASTVETTEAISSLTTELFGRRDDTRHEAIYEALLQSRKEEMASGDIIAEAFKRARRRRTRTELSSVPGSTAAAADETLSSAEFKKNLRLLVHARGRRRRAEGCPTLLDVQHAAKLFLFHATQGNPETMAKGGRIKINYAVYSAVQELVHPKLRSLLSATTFLKLPRDAADQVCLSVLLRYIVTRVMLLNAWRRLSSYESESDGVFRENDLENYVYETIAELPELQPLSEVFYPFYVFTAVRKFFFMLDPNRTGKIHAAELISSKVFWEWLQLFPAWHADVGGQGSHEPARGWTAVSTQLEQLAASRAISVPESLLEETAQAILADMHTEVLRTNWFSGANAIRVYSAYLDLDTDQNGLLSATELSRFSGGTLTNVFITRVFQEVHTYSGEMDYKAFLDFTLATEYRTSTASLKYLFSVLDLHRQGYITLFELKYFFTDVLRKMSASGQDDNFDIANICDEIFDMVHPATPGRITLDDLKHCKVGHTVLHLLTDVAGFWQYDNREALLQQQQAAREAGESPPIPTDLSHLDER